MKRPKLNLKPYYFILAMVGFIIGIVLFIPHIQGDCFAIYYKFTPAFFAPETLGESKYYYHVSDMLELDSNYSMRVQQQEGEQDEYIVILFHHGKVLKQNNLTLNKWTEEMLEPDLLLHYYITPRLRNHYLVSWVFTGGFLFLWVKEKRKMAVIKNESSTP
jgi:hypothetical protein